MDCRTVLYAACVETLDAGPETANESLLVAAREALGLTQAQMAARLSELADGQPISQGYVSRVEKGALTVSGERLSLFAKALMCTPDLLVSDAKLWSLGDGCMYHRNRASTRASTLRRLHAQVNLMRLYLHRLTEAAGWPLPDFMWVPVVTGGVDSAADAARLVRERCGIGPGPVRSVTAIAEQMGALVVALPLGGREVDATSLHPPGEPPLFVINSDVSAERQRFTLGHELGHVACEPGFGSDPEKTAQEFAGELLAPAQQLHADLKAADITPARLLQLKKIWLISAAALLYRAYDLAVIRESQYRKISAQISALGWRKSEPDPLAAERPAVVPELVRQAIKATGGIEAAAAAAGTTADVIRALSGGSGAESGKEQFADD
jgi:Zn-dependent peptidase ImmA (M78 family)/transcriptional regulator with XRE-family HTH domain